LLSADMMNIFYQWTR